MHARQCAQGELILMQKLVDVIWSKLRIGAKLHRVLRQIIHRAVQRQPALTFGMRPRRVFINGELDGLAPVFQLDASDGAVGGEDLACLVLNERMAKLSGGRVRQMGAVDLEGNRKLRRSWTAGDCVYGLRPSRRHQADAGKAEKSADSVPLLKTPT